VDKPLEFVKDPVGEVKKTITQLEQEHSMYVDVAETLKYLQDTRITKRVATQLEGLLRKVNDPTYTVRYQIKYSWYELVINRA